MLDYFQMAKRKIDCDLSDIIGSYMRKKKYEKSLTLLNEKDKAQMKNDQTQMLKKFFDYLKEKETDKENHQDESFEINFGAYQPDKKVSLILYKLFTV